MKEGSFTFLLLFLSLALLLSSCADNSAGSGNGVSDTNADSTETETEGNDTAAGEDSKPSAGEETGTVTDKDDNTDTVSSPDPEIRWTELGEDLSQKMEEYSSPLDMQYGRVSHKLFGWTVLGHPERTQTDFHYVTEYSAPFVYDDSHPDGIARYITLGRYERDNDPSNGKEDIEWIVLGFRDGRALLTTKYVIDCMPLDGTWTVNEIDTMFGAQWPSGDGAHEIHEGTVSWETSSLRKYLNGEFLENCFTDEERSLILDSETEEGITDRVFILSSEELTDWVTINQRSSAWTSYAREKEGYSVRDDYPVPVVYYLNSAVLLRPHGLIGPSYEEQQGKIYCFDSREIRDTLTCQYLGIRPCIWVAADEQ